MRMLVAVLVLGLLAAACSGDGGGGGGAGDEESARFCELMEEFVELADEAIAGASSGDAEDLEDLTDRVEEVISEAEASAPPAIADIIDSAEPEDQERITTYVTEECGVELPQF